VISFSEKERFVVKRFLDGFFFFEMRKRKDRVAR
jgi:hypothetical protein